MTEEQVQIDYLSNEDKDKFIRLVNDLRSCTDMKGLSAMLTDALSELTIFDFFLLLLYRSDRNVLVSVGPARRAHLVQKGEDISALFDGELETPLSDIKVVRKAIQGKRALELDLEGTMDLLQKVTGKAKKEVHRLAQFMRMNSGLLQPISVFEGQPRREVVVGLLFVTTPGERIEKVDRLKLSMLSKQIGVVLINELNTRRLQRELDTKESSQRLLEAFNRATLGVQMSFDEETIYRSLADSMKQAGIGLLVVKKDPATDEIMFRHMTSLRSTQTAIKHSLSLDLEDLRVKASEIPKVNEMFSLTKPIFLDDIAEIMRVLLRAMGLGPQIKKLQTMFPVERGIICPLIVKGRCDRILVVTREDLSPHHLLSVEVFAMHVRNALDRLFVQAESEDKSRQLRFMHDLSSALSRSLSIDWALEVLRKELPKVHQFDHIGILLLDKEMRSGLNIVVREAGGKGTASRTALTFDEKEAKAMGEATDLFVHGVEPDKDGVPMARAFQGAKVRSYLILPLRVENRLLGFLELGCHEEAQFSEHVLNMVSLMKDPVSTAIYNADLLADERKRSEQLRVVSEVSRFSMSVVSLKSLYREVLRLISTTFGYPCIHIIRYDRATNRFVHLHSSAPEDDKRFKDFDHPADRGVLGKAFREKRTIIVPNTKEDPDYIDLIGGMLSELAVPVLYDGEVVLLINLESKELNAFDNDDALTIETVANEVSSLLKTLGQKEKEERRLEQLSVINDIGKDLLQIVEVDRILSTAAHVMDEKLAFRGIRVFLIDRNTKGLVLKALAGLGEKAPKGSSKTKVGELVPLGAGPVGMAASKGSTTLSAGTVPKDEAKGTRRGGLARGALLCSPFKVKEEVEGVLCMEAPEDRTLDEWDQLALESMAREVGKALEMAHAFEETERRSKLLGLVNDISLCISKDLSKKGIMERFTAEFQKSRNYLDVAIFLLDNERRSLVKQAQSGDYKGRSPPDYSQNIEEGLFGVCVQKRETLVVNDVSKDKRFKARPWVKTKAEMVCPIKIGDEVIGLINVESDKVGAFENWDRLAVDTLARSLAMALQNSQLYEEEQRRSDLLKVLDELSNKALKANDLDILLQETVETLENRFKFYSVCVFMEDERKWPLGILKIRATTGAYRDLAHHGTELPSEQGLIGACFRSGKVVLCNDTTQDKRFIPEPRRGSLSELCLPIIVGGKTVGILNVESDRKDAFTQLDVIALGTVSDIISRAIQNLGQVDELTRRSHDISGVMDIEKGLTTELDRDTILQRAVKLIKKHLGYQNVEFYVIDDEAYDLELRAKASDGDRRRALQPGFRHSIDSGIIGQAYKQRTRVMVNEAMKYDRYFEGLGKTVRSAVAAPVLVNNDIVGILNIESDEPNEFGDWDSLIITVMCDLLSGALDRAARYKEQQERERVFTIAYETGNELARATSIEGLLKKAAELIKAKLRFFQVEISSLSTDDKGSQELVLRAGCGSLKKKSVAGTRFPVGEGLLGWCVTHKENAVVNDVTVDPRCSEEKGGEVKSEMVVLISVDDGVFGAVNVKSRHFNAFMERDLNGLEAVVKQLENLLWHLKSKGPN
jgi:putative methionine-R-sulfoxide reductase with GAF domain